jgi:hypothetical protein
MAWVLLGVEFGHLRGGEVPQPQRLQLDVERTGGAEPVRVTAGGSFIVADVALPAQHHRGGEPLRPLGEPVPQLAQDADQTLPAQCVDLVEEQHQRLGAGPRPRRKRLREQARVASQEKYSAAYFPEAVKSSASARSVVVFPVCRGACTTK